MRSLCLTVAIALLCTTGPAAVAAEPGAKEQLKTFTEGPRQLTVWKIPNIPEAAWPDYAGKKRPTPMTVFTIKHDGTDLKPRTFDDGMNWSSYPAPDGRHFFAGRIIENNNWEIFLFDMENPGKEPERITYNDSFDGFPSVSPDGTKLVFARSLGKRFMADNFVRVMDITPLGIGPKAKPAATADTRTGK